MKKKNDSLSNSTPKLRIQNDGEPFCGGISLTVNEARLLQAFRDLEPVFKTMVLATVIDQAAACLSRKRPMLKLVSSQGKPES